MFYSNYENEHDHITNSSETDEKDAWKDNVALSNVLLVPARRPR